jgi:small nuclear ribonucleoprotein
MEYELVAVDWALAEHPETMNKKPLSVLNANLNKPTYVKLKNGLSYKGILDKTDSQMNIILQQSVEYNSGNPSVSLGMVLIRGNNILYIRIGDFLE